MNGRQRILNMISGEPLDSLPFMPITMMFAGDCSGIPYGEYARDHKKLAEAQLRIAETFDVDYVSVISDPAREAADLGASIEWFDNQPPAIVESHALIHEKAKLAKLEVPDPLAGPRMSDRVAGAAMLAQRAGATHIVEGWIEGPCAMAADLRGVNTLMLDFYDDPAFVHDLFDFVIEMEVRFAKAQIEAGVTLMGIGDAAASLIGPKLYEQHVYPAECRLIERVRAMGVPVRLHICGNTRRIAGLMSETGAEIVDLDFLTPMGEARAASGPDQVLLGNIDPVRVLRDGTPESITAALEECWQAAGPRWICGAGCEVPRGTPHENLMAMSRFARSRS
jgi:MtaA/CmuA family methyltransferase